MMCEVLQELPLFEVRDQHGAYVKGRSDFAEHPVYQTKWLKYGLHSLGVQDRYSVPLLLDSHFDPIFAEKKTATPHTWNAAEVFL